MIPRRIAGGNVILRPPADWDATKQGKCASLVVRVNSAENWVESAWEPTPDELAMLMAGASVVLRVYGVAPPVALYVEDNQGTEGSGQ